MAKSPEPSRTHLHVGIRGAFEKYAPEMTKPEQGSFLIDAGLGMLGLTDDQKTQVEAAIPVLTDAMNQIKANMAAIDAAKHQIDAGVATYQMIKPWGDKVYADVMKAMPAIMILVNAVSAKSSAADNGGNNMPAEPEDY